MLVPLIAFNRKAEITPVAIAPDPMSAPTLAGGVEELTLTLGPAPSSSGSDPVSGYLYEVTTADDTSFANILFQGGQAPNDLGDPITISAVSPNDYIARQFAESVAGTSPASPASSAATVAESDGVTKTAVFSDVFSGTDRMDTRSGWVEYFNSVGSPFDSVVENGVLEYSNTTSTGNITHHTTATASTNKTYVEAKYINAGESAFTYMGLMANPSGAPTGYLDFDGYVLWIDTGGSPDLRVYKTVSGALTTLSVIPFTWSQGTSYKFELRCDNGVITVYQDGTQLTGLDATDGSPLLPAQAFLGVRWTGSGNLFFDDFEFGDFAESAPTVPISITTYSLDNNELSIEVEREADLYRVYTLAAMSPGEANKVIAGTNSAGTSVLAYGPDRLQFGEALAVDDDLSSLADGTWYLNTVAVAVDDGAKSDVNTLSFDRISTFATVQSTTGSPTITTGVSIDGGTYDVYDFLADGSITFSAPGIVEARYIGLGGDGGDRSGGGGSAGEFFERLLNTTGGVEVAAQAYPIVVGNKANASETSFAGLTARTGANGGTYTGSSAQDGPSGGGGSSVENSGGLAIPGIGLGNDGGPGNTNSNRGGGGGGAGGTGNQGSTNKAGSGGAGVSSDFDGTASFFAAGGGGGGEDGFGGSGVGGNGADVTLSSEPATPGAANTGSGGGGGDGVTRTGADGADGRVTIRIRTA